MEECKPSANPQGIVLVVVLVIVIETSQVEHEDENDDEDNPQSRSAESIPRNGTVLRCKPQNHSSLPIRIGLFAVFGLGAAAPLTAR